MQARQLISPEELAQNIERADWRVVDSRFSLENAARGAQDYTKGHIPGAVFMDLNRDLASTPHAASGRHPLPDIETVAKTIGRLGINNDSMVVVYDADNGAMAAARCWWIFRWLGHDRVRLLDGGLAAWSRSGGELSGDVPSLPATAFVPRVRNHMVISSDELAAVIDTDRAPKVLDARDPDRFAGAREPIDTVAGHVPGARNLPFTRSLQADGRWKGPAELESLWAEHLSNRAEEAWVAMCGSGVTACHLALSALEAGQKEPRLYAGSWSEWIREESRPRASGLS